MNHVNSFNDWLKYIINLPYLDRRVEIARTTDPPISRFLYKYKSIDEKNPTSIDRLRDILVRSRLWLSSPFDFNDPFDMSAKTVVHATSEERLARIKQYLGGMRANGIAFSKREQVRKKFMRKSVNELEKDFGEIYRRSIEKMGIFSFAGSAKSILMWSHYAKDHTGVCIQFERARDFVTLSQALSVEYSSEYPEINFIKNFHVSLSKVLLRKYEGWLYENESRIVEPELAHTYVQFDPRAVVSIIMGCRSTSEGRAVIESLLKERENSHMPPVRLFLSHQHSSQYRLVVFKHK